MLCFYNVFLLPLCCSVSLWAEEAAQQEAQEEDQEELRRRHREKPRRNCHHAGDLDRWGAQNLTTVHFWLQGKKAQMEIAPLGKWKKSAECD